MGSNDTKENDNDAKKTNIHNGHRIRLRERAIKDIRVLETHELLELVLYNYIPYKDTNPIAHDLLDSFHGLNNVFNSDFYALYQKQGMTKNAAVALTAFNELRKRALIENCEKRFLTPHDLRSFLVDYFHGSAKESFVLFCMSASGRVIYREDIQGDGSSVNFDEKRLFSIVNAHRPGLIFFAHNHPSGNYLPSKEDERMTQFFAGCGMIFEVKILDHYIVADDKVYSSFHHALVN